MQKTLGGDRLGSGKKMKVELHNYERSTHDLGYVWRSTMSAGTLVPFLTEVALPGDTFDINLGCDIKTHPTIGPLFGSYKVQLDVFQAPIRLYNSLLHNNELFIGLNMEQVKFPVIGLPASALPDITTAPDLDNCQINPSCILSYLGIRGIGYNPNDSALTYNRDFNAIPLIAYWEIYKQYYANKQEEIGAVIHTPSLSIILTVDEIEVTNFTGGQIVPVTPTVNTVPVAQGDKISIAFTGAQPIPNQIIFLTSNGNIAADEIGFSWTLVGTGSLEAESSMTTILYNWHYRTGTDINTGLPSVVTFPLSNIDDMRRAILGFSSTVNPFSINNDLPGPPGTQTPYIWLTEQVEQQNNTLSSQEGLGLKTYQSDLFNNWLQTEWIDGIDGISAVTAISTASGSFTIDTLNLSKKVYDMLNRIAVSGGSYDDWLDAVYAHDRYQRCESPMYMGGLIKELVFQEVVSNSESGEQPLGTLAGKGIMANKHKGGSITIKVDEPSYIIGIVSLTPRLDYSQGNKWDVNLQTLNDLHKPALDEIGFQDLITEQMAWWTTFYSETESRWIQQAAGKQPAWLNYMTNVNQTRGNFAIQNNEMFMTLNRRYTPIQNLDTVDIQDLTTYIDPSLYNFIFAQTALDSQNFWTQISVDMIARRKMSAKLMPNL